MSETPGPARALPPELDPRGRRGSRRVPAASRPARLHRADAGRSGAGRFLRALSWVAALTSLVVLLGSGVAYVYVSSKFGGIERIGGLCLKKCKDRPSTVGRTENFLLVGSDSRAGANSTGANAGLAGQGTDGQRSDTTMLVHLSADHEKVYVLSFARDTLVTTPRYTIPKTGQVIGGGQAKFNAAYAVGYEAGHAAATGTEAEKVAYGSQLAAAMVTRQVETLSGLPVDHYAEVDFSGFQSMVDALGGVTVCLSRDAYDPGGDGSGGSGFQHAAGRFTLGGEQALQFVRQRHGLPESDLDRIGRQQRFLAAITRQVKSAGTLLNPIKLNNFVSAVSSHVKIDEATSKQDLIGLATRLRNLDPSRVQFFTAPIAGYGGGPDDPLGSYLNLDKAKAKPLFQAIHDDRDPNAPPPPPPPRSVRPTPAPSGPPLTVPPAQASLTVQNGSGLSGQASKAAADLQAVGFPATAVDGGDRVTRTEIRYGSGRQESAQTLAAAVPGAVLVPTEANGSAALVLLTGSDYTGALPVTLGAAAPTGAPPAAAPATTAAAPTPSASPTAAPQTAQNFDCGP